MKLRGYATPDGWFGEIERGIFRLFATEADWREYLENEQSGKDDTSSDQN